MSIFPLVQLHEEDDALNMWMFDAVENNGKYTRCVVTAVFHYHMQCCYRNLNIFQC